jgi:hypothetical protein
MSSITPISNPLMQPVQYMGQTYFTGQYFHQMYRNNSDTNGKYKQFQHFARLIRSIETYQNYVDAGDIVELTKEKASPDSGLASDTETQNLRLAFKATYGKPIMLINATAQVALTHHLDDEVSKNASVNANRQTVTGQRALTALQQAKTAPALLSAFIEAGKALGTEVVTLNRTHNLM